MSDPDLQRRINRILQQNPKTNSRINGNEVRNIPKASGHASTNPTGRVTVNTNWATGGTDRRLQATLFHESLHVKQ